MIHDPQARKRIPVYAGFVKYFPDAILAVAQLSYVANEQHNPGTEVHWDRSKSGDELDALLRHTIDRAKGEVFDNDGVRQATKRAWRALADLQKEIEADGGRLSLIDEVPPESGESRDEDNRISGAGTQGPAEDILSTVPECVWVALNEALEEAAATPLATGEVFRLDGETRSPRAIAAQQARIDTTQS